MIQGPFSTSIWGPWAERARGGVRERRRDVSPRAPGGGLARDPRGHHTHYPHREAGFARGRNLGMIVESVKYMLMAQSMDRAVRFYATSSACCGVRVAGVDGAHVRQRGDRAPRRGAPASTRRPACRSRCGTSLPRAKSSRAGGKIETPPQNRPGSPSSSPRC
jgi:hypothetical protein